MVKVFLQRALGGTARTSSAKRKRCRLDVELLEARCLLNGDPFRTITGVGNNVANPNLGAANTDLIRIAPAAYADGLSAPAGANRPNARVISNTAFDQTDPANSSQDLNVQNNKALSDFIYVFGQFLDHDLDLTKDNSGQAFDIPPGSNTDPMGTEAFTRSGFDPNTGTTNARQQIQSNTSFIDGSQIYGSDAARADALRTHSGGRLKDQIEAGVEFLPFNNTSNFTTPLDMANDAHLLPDSQMFAAGDRRANETTQLISMQTLFLREHNRIADRLHALHPDWSDEKLYQTARRQVGAELEIIVYTEWLPALLGPNALPAYTGYKSNVNPGIANEFSTAMFRFAHSQLDNDVERKNNDGTTLADGAIGLDQSFFDPALIHLPGTVDALTGLTSTGIGPILKGAASADAQEVDLLAVRSIRNFLFGAPGAGGTDLIARDIQRGRDHGLTDYNSMRAAYGLPRVKSFADITSDAAVQLKLQQLYGTVDNIDAFVGALAEDHVAGADVGPLTKAVLVDQFTRLRDGDRYFYLNQFSGDELKNLLANTSLAKVIERNTNITNLQDNVFFFKASISGTVVDDDDNSGRREQREEGVRGVTVQLLDDTGAVIATTKTDSHGSYTFTEQDLNGTGNYSVALVVPSGWHQTSGNPGTISISRGDTNVDDVDFGIDENRGQGAAALPGGGSSGGGAGGGSANAVLIGALQSPSGGTTTTTALASGNVSGNSGFTGQAGAPQTVDNLQPAGQGSAANPIVSVGATVATRSSLGSNLDQFWIALGADSSDPLA